MKSFRCVLIAAMLAGAPCVHAQAAYPQPASTPVTLAPNTELVVTPTSTLVTRTARTGDRFAISTLYDVMQDGYVVIPRGTPGEGTVVYRSGKGAFGKTGKLGVEFNWLDLNGRHVPLTGTYHDEGHGNTAAVIGAFALAGLVGAAIVTGHSATLVSGQQLRARTVDALALNMSVAAPLSPAERTAAFAMAGRTLASASGSSVIPVAYPAPNGDNVVSTPIPRAY